MTDLSATDEQSLKVPSWVPRPARHYLAHTEAGAPIRALARHAGCHASTVLRQIRTFETRRDDYLVDEALRRLGQQVLRRIATGSHATEKRMTRSEIAHDEETALSEARLKSEALRVLKRLGEPGAVLAVAPGLDKAAVIRETRSGTQARTAVVDREIAEAMALKEWIAGSGEGRVARYRITARGRGALNRLVAEDENRASGFAETQAGFASSGAGQGPAVPERARRCAVAETPLVALSRRRDKDGAPFLSSDLVRAGERLREDFELAQMSPRVTQNWDSFLTGPDRAASPSVAGDSAGRARARVTEALHELGPGLGDVALRCCCYLEGLERAERRMGWSARSGKIVLRIALQRLKRHYDRLGDGGGLIG